MSKKTKKKTVKKNIKKVSVKKGATYTIGILHSGSGPTNTPINEKMIEAFIDELANNGYKVNQNLFLDPKDPLWSDDDPTKLANNARTLATNAELDLIIAAGGTASVYAVRDAQIVARTNTNVVFTSFSQLTPPTSNMTGVDARTSELDPFRLNKLYDLVHTQMPDQTTFAVLENNQRKDYDPTILGKVAADLGIQLNRLPPITPGPDKTAIIKLINQAFDGWKKAGIKVALVAADPLFNDLRSDVIKAETKYGFAAMHQWHEFKDEGGYASYGTNLMEAYQNAATIAAQVLDGKDPTEIPVQPLTNIALSINHTTAKRLGLST